MPGSTPKLAPPVPPGMISALPAGEPGGGFPAGSVQQGAGGRTPGQGGAGGTTERTRNFGEGTWERRRCGAEVVRRKVTPPQGKQGGLALLPQPPRVLLQGSPWQRGRGSGCRAPMGAWRQPRPGHPGACPRGAPRAELIATGTRGTWGLSPVGQGTQGGGAAPEHPAPPGTTAPSFPQNPSPKIPRRAPSSPFSHPTPNPRTFGGAATP